MGVEVGGARTSSRSRQEKASARGGGEGTGQVGTIGVEKMQKRLTQRAMVVVWFNTDMAIEVVWFIQNRKEGQNQMRAGKVDAQ